VARAAVTVDVTSWRTTSPRFSRPRRGVSGVVDMSGLNAVDGIERRRSMRPRSPSGSATTDPRALFLLPSRAPRLRGSGASTRGAAIVFGSLENALFALARTRRVRVVEAADSTRALLPSGGGAGSASTRQPDAVSGLAHRDSSWRGDDRAPRTSSSPTSSRSTNRIGEAPC